MRNQNGFIRISIPTIIAVFVIWNILFSDDDNENVVVSQDEAVQVDSQKDDSIEKSLGKIMSKVKESLVVIKDESIKVINSQTEDDLGDDLGETEDDLGDDLGNDLGDDLGETEEPESSDGEMKKL